MEFASYGFVLTDKAPDYVVLGFDMTLTYEKLVKACDFIRAGVPFIATHPDINCPTETGYIPDCGAMTALITASTGVNAQGNRQTEPGDHRRHVSQEAGAPGSGRHGRRSLVYGYRDGT